MVRRINYTDKYVNALTKIIEGKKRCIEICRDNGLDPETLNLTDDISNLQLHLSQLKLQLLNEKTRKEYDELLGAKEVKVHTDTVKYYKEVEDKLGYITVLRKIANPN